MNGSFQLGIDHASENKPLKHSHVLIIRLGLWENRHQPVLPFHAMALPAKKGDEVSLMRFPAHGLSLILRKLLAGQVAASVPSHFFHSVLLALTCSDV